MIDFKQIIAESIAQITNIEVNEIKGFIEVPKEQGNGDYAFPCFKLAKTLRKSPNVIADDIKANINIIAKIIIIKLIIAHIFTIYFITCQFIKLF